MNRITATDGTMLYFKDWGRGRPVVFSHGWPLTADAWDAQMIHLLHKGYRVVAHDRRGHGRSPQVFENHTMDQYADDLHALMEQLNLEGAVLVGHSTGGGEVARYLGRHGSRRVAGAVLVGSVTPSLLKTDENPDGIPMYVFDEMRRNLTESREQYFLEFTLPFFGFNREYASVSEGARRSFWLQGMSGSIHAQHECIRQFSESDFTEDLKKIEVPTLIIHGSDDQIVPIGLTATRAASLVPGAELKVIPGAPHGLPVTHREQLNAELLSFLDALSRESAGEKSA